MFNLKGALPAKTMQKLFAIAVIAALLFLTLELSVGAQVLPEYQRYARAYRE